MLQTKTHTPGPWLTTRALHGKESFTTTIATFVDGHPLVIADAFRADKEEAEANARLIAAAPDLLGTMETLVGLLDKEFDVKDILTYIDIQARAAIAKAEGR